MGVIVCESAAPGIHAFCVCPAPVSTHRVVVGLDQGPIISFTFEIASQVAHIEFAQGEGEERQRTRRLDDFVDELVYQFGRLEIEYGHAGRAFDGLAQFILVHRGDDIASHFNVGLAISDFGWGIVGRCLLLDAVADLYSIDSQFDLIKAVDDGPDLGFEVGTEGDHQSKMVGMALHGVEQ